VLVPRSDPQYLRGFVRETAPRRGASGAVVAKQRVMSRSLVAALVLMMACTGSDGEPGEPGEPASTRGTLSGAVVDGNSSAPIALASVTLTPGGSSISTANDGSFQIAQVPVGVYRLQVTATGYAASTVGDVSVVADTTTTVTVTLAAPEVTTAAVTGMVRRYTEATDPSAALAGATVALVDSATLAASSLEAPLEPLAAASPYHATT
jgi:hypothetical protein